MDKKRSWFLLTVLIIFILILLVRLFFLQIIEGSSFRKLSDENRTRVEKVSAPRGIIFDRNGYPLVRNIPGFRTLEFGETKVISRDEAIKKELASNVDLQVETIREYLYPEEFAHALGFLGEGEGGQLEGKVGLEKTYNKKLAGRDGKKLVEVNAKGEPLRVLGEVAPKTGGDITTTLDLQIARRAYRALSKVDRGAVIVTDPRNGEVLALLSKPSFDPNLFTIGEGYKAQATASSYKNVQQILTSADQPIFNRVIGGTYPPGSTFKIVTAAAGLASNAINKDTKIEDVGVINIGRFSFPNWYFTQYGKLDGTLDIVRAIKRSNDIFFYKVAELTGIDELADMGKKFGVGQILGIDIEGEGSGLFPNDAWKREKIGEGWFLGDTYHVGIGQGYLLTTPLQANAWTSVIANGGNLYKPHLLKNSKFDPPIVRTKFLSDETISLIREGMREACSPGGTGWPLFKFKIQNSKIKIDNRNFFEPEEATVSAQFKDFVHIPVACKTGTAEFGDPAGQTHAWFTAFAPIEDPQIAVTVLVEGGGEGSNVAAPIAKEILEEWFSR